MPKPALVTLAVIVVGALSACSGSNVPPTAPSPLNLPPNPPARAPGNGTIAIRELVPGAGSALTVADCPLGPATRACAGPWTGTFDVLVDREMTNAVLTVRFYEGGNLCGYGANTVDVVPAGSPVSFTISQILVSDEFRTFGQPCQLPATTTRLVAELWSDSSSWSNALIQELTGVYTFRNP